MLALYMCFLSLVAPTKADLSTLKVRYLVYASRHGIRPPYPPPVGGIDAYSKRSFPGPSAWNMSKKEYDNQELTPHGRAVLPLLGRYLAKVYRHTNLYFREQQPCPWKLEVFADNSTRDVQTAQALLQGFAPECNVNVQVAGKGLPEMEPVLSDHYDIASCAGASREQLQGAFGGQNLTALPPLYKSGIDRISAVLETESVPADKSICHLLNASFSGENCTLMDLPTQWTDLDFEGLFLSPLTYAAYFAEAFSLQYLSGLPMSKVAFGKLALPEITELYRMHSQEMAYGTNYWNAQRNAAQTLGYILGSLEEVVSGSKVEGVSGHPENGGIRMLFFHDTNILMLRKLLGLEWVVRDFGINVAATGGALGFELIQDSADKASPDSDFVRIYYIAATPEQQRNAHNLTLENPPSVSYLVINECGAVLCPYPQFRKIVLDTLDLRCTVGKLQLSLKQVKAIIDKTQSDCDVSNREWTVVVSIVGSIAGGSIFVGIAIYCIYRYRKRRRDSVDRYRELPDEVRDLKTDNIEFSVEGVHD